MNRAALTLFVAWTLGGGAAWAAAPPPVKAATPGMYTGRWYQTAQILKTNHHPCPGATEDFSPTARGEFSVRLTCHPNSGAAHAINARVAIVPNSGNTKFKMSFFGGLISQEFWLVDHAADQSWALMATPGGNYLWLLTRRPVLDPPARAAVVARIQALGYDTSKLVTDR